MIQARLAVIAATCAIGCASQTPASSSASSAAAHPTPPACMRLCDDEARCGSTDHGCATTCERNAKILEPSVVDAVVACRAETLKTACFGAESAFTHGELLADEQCFDAAVEKVAPNEAHRSAIARATCARMIKCQVSGADVEKECVAAAMHPPEKDEQEAMRVVDALRDEVIATWTKCLDAAPCPPVGSADTAADACGVSALGRAP